MLAPTICLWKVAAQHEGDEICIKCVSSLFKMNAILSIQHLYIPNIYKETRTIIFDGSIIYMRDSDRCPVSNRGPILKSTSTDVTYMCFYFVTWWMLVKFIQHLYHCIFYQMNTKRQSFRHKFSTPHPHFVYEKADQHPLI